MEQKKEKLLKSKVKLREKLRKLLIVIFTEFVPN